MTMRVLITGADGFVGPHVAKSLRLICNNDVEIVATSKKGGEHPVLGSLVPLDVTDMDAVTASFKHFLPSHVIHLAGIASVSEASADSDAAWRVNVSGAQNVARAILSQVPKCWFLHVGSGLSYGETAKRGYLLDENAPLAPIDDYGATKASADLVLGAQVRRGLKVIRLRPFNHIGAGQSEAFVASAFGMQIARIEAGMAPPVLRVGNLSAERDFLDVRDVTRAYAMVAYQADQLKSGLILNIASGIPRRAGEILEYLRALSRLRIAIEVDPLRQRPSDLPSIVGNASRIRTLLSWRPQYSFQDTISSILDDCRKRVGLSQH